MSNEYFINESELIKSAFNILVVKNVWKCQLFL